MAAAAQGGPPLITDDPDTPGDGRWEINVGAIHQKLGRSRQYQTPDIDINYGLGDWIQLKFEVAWLGQSETGRGTLGGLGNSAVGVKWRFLERGEHGLHASLYPQYSFNNPTSSAVRGLVGAGTEFVMPVEASLVRGRFAFDAEVGLHIVQAERDGWIHGVIADYQVAEHLDLVSEVHGEQPFDGDDALSFNAGAVWELVDGRTLLLSAGRRLGDAASGAPDFQVYLGVQLHIQSERDRRPTTPPVRRPGRGPRARPRGT